MRSRPAPLRNQTETIRFHPERSKKLLEQLIDAKLHCPVGGDLQLVRGEDPRFSYWGSSNWTKPSRYQECDVPEKYQFGFLNWLRGLTLESTLQTGSRTLHSRLELELHETRGETTKIADANERTVPRKAIVKAPQRIDGILISNHSDRAVKYRCRKNQGVWSEWYTIAPDQDHQFDIDETMYIEFRSRLESKHASVMSGSHMEFVSPRSSPQEQKLQTASP